MARKRRGSRKRFRADSQGNSANEERQTKRQALLNRSGVMRAMEATSGHPRKPAAVHTKAYQMWSDFYDTPNHSEDDLISVLKVSTFMQDPSTAEKAASMLAGICRTEFADQYISYLERLSEGKFSAMPLSATLENLAKDLDDASLALVLSHVPCWHLAGTSPTLSSTALVAHGLTKQEDVRLDNHFGQGIGVMGGPNHETDEDSDWEFRNDDVGEEQPAAGADCEHGEGEAEAAYPPPRLHHFAKFLSGMTLPRTVKSLSLAGNDLDADMVYLAGMPENLESMTHLDISDNQIGAEGLCRLLPGLRQLQSLNLSRTGIEEDDFHLFMPLLSPLTSLTALNMSESNVSTDVAASVLMAALWPLHQLRSLTIEEEYLDDVVLEHTFKAPAFKRLEHFVASEFSRIRRKPTDRLQSMDAFATAAANPAVRLKTLQLPLCCGTGAAIMLRAVSQLTSLECLRIRAEPTPVPLADDEQEADDGPEGALVELPLGPSLAALPQLRTLCVVLTSATLVSFAGSVSALTCLTSLDLSDSALEAPADAAGVARLAELKMLNVFIFNDVAFCKEVGDKLRAVLPHLAALQELQVFNLKIQTRGTIIRLHEVLYRLRSLKKLVMGSDTRMLNFGPVPIRLSDLAVLAPMTQLTHLDVRGGTQSSHHAGAPIPEASPQQAEAAYAALAGLTNLEHLTLQGFGVACPADPATVVQQTDNFLLNLTGMLDKMPRLSELNIENCPLWEGQAEAFGAALSRRTALSTIRLVNCRLMDEPAQIVARHLCVLPRLRHVSMAENLIADLKLVIKLFASSMATSWDLQD